MTHASISSIAGMYFWSTACAPVFFERQHFSKSCSSRLWYCWRLALAPPGSRTVKISGQRSSAGSHSASMILRCDGRTMPSLRVSIIDSKKPRYLSSDASSLLCSSMSSAKVVNRSMSAVSIVLKLSRKTSMMMNVMPSFGLLFISEIIRSFTP